MVPQGPFEWKEREGKAHSFRPKKTINLSPVFFLHQARAVVEVGRALDEASRIAAAPVAAADTLAALAGELGAGAAGLPDASAALWPPST